MALCIKDSSHHLPLTSSFPPPPSTACTFPFTSHVLGVVPEWGVVNVLTKDGRITQLREHDTQSKLENLFKRNLFDYAVA